MLRPRGRETGPSRCARRDNLLTDGSGTFVVQRAVVADVVDGGSYGFDDTFYLAGTVLFHTPGLEKNNLPTITCLNTSATSGITSWVTGKIASTTK